MADSIYGDDPPRPGLEQAVYGAAVVTLAEAYARVLLQIVGRPWRLSSLPSTGFNPEGRHCSGCGWFFDPAVTAYFDGNYHGWLCPWLLAAEVLLGLRSAA